MLSNKPTHRISFLLKCLIKATVILSFIWLLETTWLILSVLAFIVAYYFALRLKATILKYTVVLLLTLLILIFSKIFVFVIFQIPSSSMESTYFPGDLVVVNKLTYGPRIPQSPLDIPWINIIFYELSRSSTQHYNWPYKRFSGRSPVKRGDIFVFKSVDVDTETLVKRCLGIPGDTIQIIDRQVVVNHKAQIEPDLVFQLYVANFTNLNLTKSIFRQLKIPYWLKTDSGLQAYVMLNRLQKLTLLKYPAIKKLYYNKVPVSNIPSTFPWDWHFNWTIENYGPLVVPARGTIIPLNFKSYVLYKKTFEKFEGVKIELWKDKYYLKGRCISSYQFKNNYYFMLGDNRNYSSDSRFWGILPEQNIEGKVLY
jgi:signal peptidase I